MNDDTAKDNARSAGPDREAVRKRAREARDLLAAGQVGDAVAAFQEVIAARPDHRVANVSLAAVLGKHGRRDDARRFLSDFYDRRPLGPVSRVGGGPLVLKIRGFDRTEITLARHSDGQWRTKFRGGHFTTTYLLVEPAFRMRTFTIARENILQPGIVPRHALMLNTIAEPDVEGASLGVLARYLGRAPDTAIINRPEKVMQTTRDGNWRRLRDFPGVIFPRTQRIRLTASAPEAVVETMRAIDAHPPFIIRQVGTQTGRTTTLVERPEDLAGYTAAVGDGEHYVIDYRRILWRGEYFRKLRLFWIDGAYYPVVCHLDKVWNVHGGNRKDIMRADDALMDEERRFLADWRSFVGTAAADALERLGPVVGLEFFGVDFTIDDDGKVFIYELNPAMRHSFDHARNFPYKLPYDEAVSAAFARMIERRL